MLTMTTRAGFLPLESIWGLPIRRGVGCNLLAGDGGQHAWRHPIRWRQPWLRHEVVREAFVVWLPKGNRHMVGQTLRASMVAMTSRRSCLGYGWRQWPAEDHGFGRSDRCEGAEGCCRQSPLGYAAGGASEYRFLRRSGSARVQAGRRVARVTPVSGRLRNSPRLRDQPELHWTCAH
jgi:hypothetical protein